MSEKRLTASRDQQTVGAFDAVLGGKVAVYDIVTLDRELVVGVGFLRDVLLGRDQVDRVLEQRSKDVVVRSKLFADPECADTSVNLRIVLNVQAIRKRGIYASIGVSARRTSKTRSRVAVDGRSSWVVRSAGCGATVMISFEYLVWEEGKGCCGGGGESSLRPEGRSTRELLGSFVIVPPHARSRSWRALIGCTSTDQSHLPNFPRQLVADDERRLDEHIFISRCSFPTRNSGCRHGSPKKSLAGVERTGVHAVRPTIARARQSIADLDCHALSHPSRAGSRFSF